MLSYDEARGALKKAHSQTIALSPWTGTVWARVHITAENTHTRRHSGALDKFIIKIHFGSGGDGDGDNAGAGVCAGASRQQWRWHLFPFYFTAYEHGEAQQKYKSRQNMHTIDHRVIDAEPI